MARKPSKVKYTSRTPGARGPQVGTYTVNLKRTQRAWWVRRARELRVSKSSLAQELFDRAIADDSLAKKILRRVFGGEE